jgi:lipopolysaccharide/colanic/teichoic acid biosynthesis glycosyltransferase
VVEGTKRRPSIAKWFSAGERDLGARLKRAFDVVVSSFTLVLASPILLVVAGCVRFTLGSPVFYRQPRPGKDEIPFNIVKFRTMQTADRENEASEMERISRLGQVLRRTSLDELPEFFNVLKGEMSLVGPRPLLMEYLPLYNSEQKRRHEVAPGITGLAQVKGRNAVVWSERLRLDVWYVDNQSFWLDMHILVSTVRSVISGSGVNFSLESTMPKFDGR